MTEIEPVAEVVPYIPEPILPMAPEAAKQAMQHYQALTNAMLIDDDWQRASATRRFVKRSGWSKISTGYGLSVDLLSENVDRNETGEPIRAAVTVRVSHPNGRHEDGTGRCSITEPSFNTPAKRAKAEHDIPATAFTRARNRGISNLVGFGAVSAEEVDAGDVEPVSEWGELASDQLKREAAQAVQKLHPGLDGFEFMTLLSGVFKIGVPKAAARALVGLAWFVQQPQTTEPENAPPGPGQSAYHQPNPEDVNPPGRYSGD